MLEHSSDRACVAWFEYFIGYLATLVPVGSMHRAKTAQFQSTVFSWYGRFGKLR